MANHVYKTVCSCETWAPSRDCLGRKRHLKLFLATGPLAFMATRTLGPLPRPKNRNVFVIVTTDRYPKLTQTVPTLKTTATHIAKLFLNHLITSNEIPYFLSADNAPQIVSKFFATLRGFFGLKHVTTTAYHPDK